MSEGQRDVINPLMDKSEKNYGTEKNPTPPPVQANRSEPDAPKTSHQSSTALCLCVHGIISCIGATVKFCSSC